MNKTLNTCFISYYYSYTVMIHSIEIPLLMQYSIIIVDAIDMSQVVLYENLHRNYGYTWSSETKACEVVCNFMHEQPFVYMTTHAVIMYWVFTHGFLATILCVYKMRNPIIFITHTHT